jgi:hypothetical protein
MEDIEQKIRAFHKQLSLPAIDYGVIGIMNGNDGANPTVDV